MRVTTITLTPAQEQVIALLSTGATLTHAAQSAGVHRNTIANWRQTDPAFTRALASAQYDRVLHFHSLVEEHAELAISTIHDLLADPKTPAGVRLKAALAILKQCTTLPTPEPALTDVSFKRNIAQLLDPTKLTPESVHNFAQLCTTESAPALETYRRDAPKVGRNEPCPCLSGRKYKQCCLNAAGAVAA